ncbi:IS66 family insertion sequence element accessory protein TnpA [Pseudorhodoplanes sp.]|uniref:IS66 family insertion sequence element accessory protein TnpA n=1 Tax=Pseudorhodoplanes sp. TaxID=1934341 RepID=UPI003D0BB395
MASEQRRWKRQHEAFWRAHHEGWKRSDLNQRQYCELHGLPQKAFENWRQKFRAEPQPPERKLLYRTSGLRHRLSHIASHSLGHMTTEPVSRPIVPPARDGRRRAFNEEDKRRIVEEATQPGANLSAVARHYGIAVRLVFRWKQELASAAEPTFIAVHITDNDEEAVS